jgi:predicted amidohydrolase YtcJ
VNENDYPRFNKLNISTSFSPYWFQKDSFSEKLEETIGKERVHNIYPVNHFLQNDVRVSFGSDWPVSTPNPLEAIEVAVTHRGLCISDDKESYISEHKISVIEAVRAYTISSAEVLGLQDVTGSIEVGKRADMIILDKNIFKLKPYQISRASVITTFIDGKIVYNNTNLK